MTLLQALRSIGYDAPRWVSPSGRVVFSDAATATPVKPHTFHGGAALVEAAPTATDAWWSDPEYIAREAAAMMTFPDFTRVQFDDQPPGWIGTIDTGYGRFKILVQHRRDHGLPHVVPVSPRRRERPRGRSMMRSDHLYDNGNLCVAESGDWDAWTDTAATVVAWAAHWHACYVAWRSGGGVWPTPGLRAPAAR